MKSISKSKKVVLGIVTLWPIVYMVFFMASIFFLIASTPSNAPSNQMSPILRLIIPLHILTILLSFFLLFIYIRNLFHNERVPQDKKALWAVVLFLGNMFAMPVYWYLYIWKEK